MKIQIDTVEKTIKIEEKVNLGELFSYMEQLFPDLKWREFDLEVGTIINWINPITFPVYPQPFDPYYPWIVTCDGTYNVNIS